MADSRTNKSHFSTPQSLQSSSRGTGDHSVGEKDHDRGTRGHIPGGTDLSWALQMTGACVKDTEVEPLRVHQAVLGDSKECGDWSGRPFGKTLMGSKL